MNKRIALVTGGAGFIGSNVVKKLLKEGWKVKVIDNLSTGHFENLIDLNVDFYNFDILDLDDMGKVFENVDVVFHLAASVGRQKSIEYPVVDASINVIGTINVLQSMIKYSVPRIVYSSSAAIYGELIGSEIDELHPLTPNSPYGVTKLASEQMIMAYHMIYGLEAFALRYFNIYGVNQRYDLYGNVIPIFAKRLSSKENVIIFGSGKQTRDFVNVKDVANANYLAAISNKNHGIYNIGSGTTISINELADKMSKLFKCISSPIYKEERVGDVMHCKANISKAQSELNFIPMINLDDGLDEYLKWFLANKSNE